MAPRTPLVRPRAYFAERVDAVAPGLGVFAAHLVGTFVFLYLVVRVLLGRLSGLDPAEERALRSALRELLFTFAFVTAVVSVIALLAVAAVMHYGSPGGDYADALAVAGWAYAPDALALPVRAALARRRARAVVGDATSPEALAARTEAFEAAATGPTLLIEVVVVAWSVYLLAHGLAGASDADVSETAVPALFVGIVSLAVRVLS